MVTTTRPPTGHLAADVTSFVGRRREIEQTKRLLSTRLTTLTGPGGVGKTRLALRVAGDLPRAFPDGVWLVELADLRDPALLAHTVADQLGIRDPASRWVLTRLADFLGSKHLLLVLDNCEHLIDACAVLADSLLRACPDLRILATSRQPLRTAGESCLLVGPLAQCEAVNLFADRAAAVLPGFTVDERNAAAVASLVRQLDGIPLAIELATVRLRALSVDQVLERLSDRYRLLTRGTRSAPPRQQTLRSLIDWSYYLCTERERTVWARLAVFAGGFELDPAEDVCAGADISNEDVLDVVASLVDKSVLLREEHGPLVRYRMLETIRQYGQERLAEAGEEELLRRGHRDWYERLVERFEAEWLGPDQAGWLTRLRLEHGNLRAAMDYCLTAPAPATEQYAGRAKALRVTGWLTALHTGDADRARALLNQAGELDDRLGVALCFDALGWIAAGELRHEHAATLLGAADVVWAGLGTSIAVFAHLNEIRETSVARVRKALGDHGYDAAYLRGSQLAPEQATALALEEPEAQPAQAHAGGAGGPEPLTRREWEIAELIAQGTSNRAIAVALTIAQRTAEGHVERILRKLGFGSRAQVAAWVGERRGDAELATRSRSATGGGERRGDAELATRSRSATGGGQRRG